jgi:hypothetical protein
VLLIGCLAVVPSGCMPLFVPPVPTDVLRPAPGWRWPARRRWRWWPPRMPVGGLLRLSIVFDEVPEAAWVSVQWFGPVGGERASDARWVEPADVGRPWTWDAPNDLALEPGTWRAVLSVGDRLLRQLDVEVPSD